MKKKEKRNKKISVLAVCCMFMTTMLAFLVLGGIGQAGDTGGGWVDSGTSVTLANGTANVGIGTSYPTEKLDVAGTIQMTGFKMPTGASYGYVLTSDGFGIGIWQPLPPYIDGDGTTNYLAKFVDSDTLTTSIIYETSGRIGIGMTNPSEILDVNGNIHSSGKISCGNSITIDGDNDKITASGGTINFDDEHLVTTGTLRIGQDSAPYTAGTLKFDGDNFLGYDGSDWQALDVQSTSGGGWTRDTGVVRLTYGTDQVGIGTTSPLSELTIHGGTGTNNDAILTFDVDGTNWYMGVDDDPSDTLKIGTGTVCSSGYKLTITTAGNVGIGIASPDDKLHVNCGHIRLSTGYGINFGGTNTRIIEDSNDLILDAAGNLKLQPDDDIYIGSSFAIFETGNERLGIGTTSPGAILDIEAGSGDGGAATIGYSDCSATGDYSIAMGKNSVALQTGAIAMGYNARAERSYSIAIGSNVEVDSTGDNGYRSMALGNQIKVEGDYSIGIGLDSSSSSTITDNHVLAIMGGRVGIGEESPQRTLHVTNYNQPPLRIDANPGYNKHTENYYMPIDFNGYVYYIKLYS